MDGEEPVAHRVAVAGARVSRGWCGVGPRAGMDVVLELRRDGGEKGMRDAEKGSPSGSEWLLALIA